MSTIRYRQAEQADMPWAWQLFKTGMRPYIEQTWGWDELFQRHAFMANLPPSSFTIIVHEAQDVGGYCVKREADHLYLDTLLIAPEWQYRGLGSHVVRHIQQQALEEEQPLYLRVLKCNPVSRFYQRLGFEIFDEDPQRYYLRWTS